MRITTDTVREHDLELRVTARIGSVDDPSESRLSRVVGLDVDRAARRVYLADATEHQVKVFSEDGEFLTAWGREGQGPGEFEGPADVAVARDTVVVADGRLVHTFTTDGEFLTSDLPRTRLRVTFVGSVRSSSGGWWLRIREIQAGVTGSTPFRRTYRFSPGEGIPPHWTYQRPHPGSRLPGILEHQPVSDVLGDRFVESRSADYELRIVAADGTLQRILRFETAPVPVSVSARTDYERNVRVACARSAAPTLCQARADQYLKDIRSRPIPKIRPVIGGLLGSDDGRILVQRVDLDPEPFSPGGDTRWDVVDVNGRWLGAARFPERFTPLWLGRARLWGVQLDDFDVPQVVGFEFR